LLIDHLAIGGNGSPDGGEKRRYRFDCLPNLDLSVGNARSVVFLGEGWRAKGAIARKVKAIVATGRGVPKFAHRMMSPPACHQQCDTLRAFQSNTHPTC
jgi:hypothetical protein